MSATDPTAGNRLFISTVSNEFKTCRERLAENLRFPEVDVQTQEQNIANLAAGQTILIKLDDYIVDCDAVIHLIGQQTSTDGTPASKAAVDDLLGRYSDLPSVIGLREDELRTLSYTQWEAWLALYHRKTKRPNLRLIIATPTTAFVPDHPADAATAHAQKLSQAWHEKELQQRGRYSEISFEEPKDLSIAILRALKDILPAQQPQQRIAQTRLISRHTAADFLGRDKELALLDDAWAAAHNFPSFNSHLRRPPPPVNLLSIIAWGGVGKTALLAYWVQSRFVGKGWLNAQGQPDPIAYVDWTFYDQGTRSDEATHAGAASVGTFFQSALRHFGDPDPENPQDKAARLARLIQTQRSLLVLDGLEPLQYPLNNKAQAGQLTDPDLRELLGLLAQRNPGLVIISSRQALTDFPSTETGPVQSKALEELPVEFAVALLKRMKIIGTDEELKEAAEDYFCHALSLIVLGRFLIAKGGDIRLRKEIPLERANENRNQRITRNLWHMMEAYEQWLASPEGNAAELQALRLTGLFDRPASPDCLADLRKAPAIHGLTDQLVPLSDDAWNNVLHRLHEANLLQLRFPPVDPGSFALRPEAREVTVDVHPLIREYFAKHLREKHKDGFKAVHSRLFDHLCKTKPHRPDTLERLQPLYQAVAHGCLAQRQGEAFDGVFIDRILRGTGTEDFYAAKVLGASACNLTAIRAFIDAPWPHKSRLLLHAQAGIGFRSLGRMSESIEMVKAEVDKAVQDENWQPAARLSMVLSDLEVTLGLLDAAEQSATSAAEYANRVHDPFVNYLISTGLADVHLHKGNIALARQLWISNDPLRKDDDSRFSVFASFNCYRLAVLQMTELERTVWRLTNEEASPSERPIKQQIDDTHYLNACTTCFERAQQTLARSLERGYLLDIALDKLSESKSILYRRLIGSESGSSSKPLSSLIHETLSAFRRANELAHLPLALLTAALHYHRIMGDAETALGCLGEAQQIAERGPMPLYLADVHLHRARLFHDKSELQKARRLIEKHGYWRRKEELEDAEAAAAAW